MTLKRPAPSLVPPPKKRLVTCRSMASKIFLLSPYAYDIHEADRQTEKYHRLSLIINNLGEIQNEVTEHMRAVLVDWLIEVVEEFQLRHHVLFFAVDYLDRVLSVLKVPRASLQLVGITCLFIATKFDGGNDQNLENFVSVTDGLYTRDQALAAEQLVLGTLGFRMMTSTIASFLPMYLIVVGVEKGNGRFYAKYLSETVLSDYGINRKYLPSQIAASIVLLTKRTFDLKTTFEVKALEDFSQYTEASLEACVQDIQKQLLNSEFLAARNRYNQVKYGYISTQHSSS